MQANLLMTARIDAVIVCGDQSADLHLPDPILNHREGQS